MAARSPREGTDIPPKLPDTTNLVLMRSRKEYREMRAMPEIVKAENKRPPLKKLMQVISQRIGGRYCSTTHAFPKNKTPVPTNDFKSYAKKKVVTRHSMIDKLAIL
jgi:hypothetical protein